MVGVPQLIALNFSFPACILLPVSYLFILVLTLSFRQYFFLADVYANLNYLHKLNLMAEFWNYFHNAQISAEQR